jgi:hypothetical protein
MCQCALPCVEAVEFGAQCPQGKAAVTNDDGCFCVGALCNSVECQKETIEVDGEVQCSPDDEQLSACVCKNNACTFRCSDVTCADGLVCDPTDGRCKQQSCLLPQFACEEDERCTLMDSVWRCVADECAGQTCGADEACRDGECIGSCAKVMCQPGEKCEDGECVVDRCSGVLCDPGLLCDPSDGDCVMAGACVAAGCADGQVCDRVGGMCAEDPCLRTRCPYGEQCNEESGQCELRCGGTLLYCGEDNCINPLTSREHCGASGDCMGENAGVSCADGLVCSEGVCSDMCAGNRVNCGGECIDPQTDRLHCGASGECTGDSAGEPCQTGFTCIEGGCRRTTGTGGSGRGCRS